MISSVHIMTTAGTWEKAGTLLVEMGLERDVEDLQRVRLEMQVNWPTLTTFRA